MKRGLYNRSKSTEQGDYKYVRKDYIFLRHNCNFYFKEILKIHLRFICQIYKVLEIIFFEDKSVLGVPF